jgi:YebC/PmpR family DNA-binding regulatory protein
MSGHSKWKTIKRQKGAADAKRGQIFTKLSMAISIAVRQGGGIGDPNSNPRLRLAIDAAKAASMPKENIDRAIQRALGKQATEMEEVTYEGFGPGGFSIIIEAITDNKQRTTPEVKNKMEKMGGTMGTPGSVSYLYEQKGLVTVEKKEKTVDDIFLLAADAGAEDVEEAGEDVLVYTKPEDLAKVRDSLRENGLNIKNAEFTRKPLSYIELTDAESARRAIDFTEKLEELDDIQKIYANFDIPDEIGKEIL